MIRNRHEHANDFRIVCIIGKRIIHDAAFQLPNGFIVERLACGKDPEQPFLGHAIAPSLQRLQACGVIDRLRFSDR